MAKKIKPIKTAVLGLGRAGWKIHVKAMRGRKEFEITDVADPIPERLREAKEEFGCNTFTTVTELLKHTKAGLIVVATKSIDHYKHTMAAFRAGKHVLVEKPMAMSYAQAQRMLAEARKRRRRLFVHQSLRFNDEILFCKHICNGTTETGKIFSIQAQLVSFKRRNDWQTLRKYGGGLLNNSATHILDGVLYMLEDVVTDVLCDMKHTTDSGNCEDHIMILLKTKRGVSVNLTLSSSCNTDAPRWILMGEYGTVSIYSDRAEMRYFDPRKHKKLKVLDTIAALGRAYGNKERLRWYVRKLKIKAKKIESYYDNIYSVLRRKGKMIVTPESVVEMTRVLELCRRQNPAFKL